MLFIILLLVVAVAAFNIVSTLVMVVKDKRSRHRYPAHDRCDPAQHACDLHDSGRGNRRHRNIGWSRPGRAAIASISKTLVHGLEAVLSTQFLDAEVYNMSDLPAHVSWRRCCEDLRGVLSCYVVSTLYPSWRAARTQPAQALRHE